MLIFFGRVQDIENNSYETGRAEAYFVPEGVAVDLYSNTLHSVPCLMDIRGFKCAVISLKGTGAALKSEHCEHELLHSRNRWIIAHAEAEEYVNKETQIGLIGENIEVFTY